MDFFPQRQYQYIDSKSNTPLYPLAFSFFKKYLNPWVKINKMVSNGTSIDSHRRPSGRSDHHRGYIVRRKFLQASQGFISTQKFSLNFISNLYIRP